MLPDLGQIGPFTVRTYTLLIDLSILIGLSLLTWQGWRLDDEPVRWLDVGLWALAAGIVAGRIAHVLIHWTYFSERPAEIPAFWMGGIDWHGAVLVGLAGAIVASLRLRVYFRDFGGVAAIALPLGALLAYAGCFASGCGHGREVPSLAGYPPYIAAELPDLYGIIAPRYQTQLFGLAWSLLVLLIALTLARIQRTGGARLWIILALLGAGAFATGFTRGDAILTLGPLRLDQILDLVVVLVGLVGIDFGRRQLRPAIKG